MTTDTATVVYTLQITQILGPDSKFIKAREFWDKEHYPEYMQFWARRIEDRMKSVIDCDDITCSKIQVFPSKGVKTDEW